MSSIRKDFDKKIIVDTIRNPTFEDQFRGLPDNMALIQAQNLSYGEDLGDKNRSLSDVELNITTYPLKLTMIGNSQVGKTQLTQVFVDDHFEMNTLTTIAYELKTKQVLLKNCQKIKVKIWDIAG